MLEFKLWQVRQHRYNASLAFHFLQDVACRSMLAMAFEAATCLALSYTAQAYMRDLKLDLES